MNFTIFCIFISFQVIGIFCEECPIPKVHSPSPTPFGCSWSVGPKADGCMDWLLQCPETPARLPHAVNHCRSVICEPCEKCVQLIEPIHACLPPKYTNNKWPCPRYFQCIPDENCVVIQSKVAQYQRLQSQQSQQA